jgi:hypothetical protein
MPLPDIHTAYYWQMLQFVKATDRTQQLFLAGIMQATPP